jgi:hypothetical protein
MNGKADVPVPPGTNPGAPTGTGHPPPHPPAPPPAAPPPPGSGPRPATPPPPTPPPTVPRRVAPPPPAAPPPVAPPPVVPPPAAPAPKKRTLRARFLHALPFTDNLVNVVAGLLAITTFFAGAFGYVAKTERDQRNELEGAVASLERQRDDLKETNASLTTENASLRDENDALEAQIDDSPSTSAPSVTLPTEEGTPGTTTYTQIYRAQDLTLTGACGHENAADLDVPEINGTGYNWEVDYGCGNETGRLLFAGFTRHAAGPANATAEQCADLLRRSGIGNDDTVVPLNGAVLCVETSTDNARAAHRNPRIVRMVVKSVDGTKQVAVNVEAWEPD